MATATSISAGGALTLIGSVAANVQRGFPHTRTPLPAGIAFGSSGRTDNRTGYRTGFGAERLSYRARNLHTLPTAEPFSLETFAMMTVPFGTAQRRYHFSWSSGRGFFGSSFEAFTSFFCCHDCLLLRAGELQPHGYHPAEPTKVGDYFKVFKASFIRCTATISLSSEVA